MRMEKFAARFFNMTDEVWAKHANPLSVWTRYSCLPLLCIAVWSRDWIGGWALIPGVVVILWVWLNPRVFGKPKTTNHWASKAVLGERVLLMHPKDQIPSHHLRAIGLLKSVTFAGFVLAIYGLVVFHLWFTVFGTILTILGKTWFLDRMVWLYQDLEDQNAQYRSWVY
ncbi:DUF6653 family protein [Litoribacillus peritrichatus]|uniref:Uncharacterized protein n=1 Tax=Litoribacillus peritrichatus TaxID=718191 RepID=A0ABP7M7N4_9GAMM